MNSDFKTYLLNVTHANDCHKLEVIQSLWSGYGEIARYRLHGSEHPTVVVKHISLDQQNNHPRGWNTSYSHQRKIKSYTIETSWYQKWSHDLGDLVKIPSFIGSCESNHERLIILEDLKANYPVIKQQLNIAEIKVCLEWLANFHALHFGKSPEGLWNIGTYWHLATRQEELLKVQHLELKNKATLIDQKLNECVHQTIVHGDAKVANFCFSNDGKSVAAVDFQYVGGGCGMKDVAYFLGSCLDNESLETCENEMLDYYFKALQKAVLSFDSVKDFNEIEKEWRYLYPFACADFTRFMLGWMPTHQKINSYNLKKVQEVLKQLN